MNWVIIDESQTVAEFIETLKQFPQDLPVRINCEPGCEIYVDEQFYDGDPDSMRCPIIKAVLIN